LGFIHSLWAILPLLNSYTDQIQKGLDESHFIPVEVARKPSRSDRDNPEEPQKKRIRSGAEWLKEKEKFVDSKSNVSVKNASRIKHPLESMIKTRGVLEATNSWQVVDWSNPFTPEEDDVFSCEFTPYVSGTTKRQADICVHTFNDIVSENIQRSMGWKYCRILPKLWTANGMIDDNSLYVDIGANIGSCVMEMLLSTNATVIAFEPHPMNVYNLKKTLSKLGKHYQDRLLLFPIGLGSSASASVINSAKGNMGNSQIIVNNLSHTTDASQQFPINIERLDSILDAEKIMKIRLVKMDVQGFECNALNGFGAIGQKIEIMKFEYEQSALIVHMCLDLIASVRGTGLKVFKMDLVSEVMEDPKVILPRIELYAARDRINIGVNSIPPFIDGQWLPVTEHQLPKPLRESQWESAKKAFVKRNTNSSSVRTKHPMESIVKRIEGSGDISNWKLVDWSNPFTPEEDSLFSCLYTPYVSDTTGRRAEMCVHSVDDVVSNVIKLSAGWPDCKILPKLWRSNNMDDDNSLYLDIGANIGSCVIEMLLSTNATVIAFEPHPMNAYNLKKTVLKLGKDYQDRLLLFPIGLANSASNTIINSAKGNMGNSQLNRTAKFSATSLFDKKMQFPVSIERLDSVLDESKIDKIRLVKMDVQGFECNAVEGMGHIG
jgi:FkbM family methyltransferase